MQILGVNISELSRKEARDKVREFLNLRQTTPNPSPKLVRGKLLERRGKQIFTPNPEFLVKAQKDKVFKSVLNQADLNLPDGRGLQLVSSGKLKVIPGSDFMLDICQIAEKNAKSIYLMGSGNEEVVKNTVKELKNKFPNLKIAGYNKGPKVLEVLDFTGYTLKVEQQENQEVIDDINFKKPDILFVALPFGKQEKWISEFLAKLPNVKIAMGVGGTFDFLSGKIRRAPKWVRIIWLEWLWRLIQEPKRIGRIYNATIKFLYLYTLSFPRKRESRRTK